MADEMPVEDKQDAGPQPVAFVAAYLMPNGTINCQWPGEELIGRGLIDKLRAEFDNAMRMANLKAQMQNAPRIVGANGHIKPGTHLPRIG